MSLAGVAPVDRVTEHSLSAVPRTRLYAFVPLALFALTLSSCRPQNSARGVVDRFIEAYYVAISLKDAEAVCTGLALSKIKQEEKLTEGQVIDRSTRKPVVHYRLKDERTAPERSTFLFEAKIDVPDGGSFGRKWMITARKEGQDWKVSNFSEYE